MPNKQIEIINKEMHQNARDLARSYVDIFATTLLLEAKTIAYNKKDEMVLHNHVKDAYESIQKKREQDWVRQLAYLWVAHLWEPLYQGSYRDYNLIVLPPSQRIHYLD